MNEAYYFHVGALACILNVQTSRVGYSYPRVFVRFPDNSYINCDFTLGRMFAMTEASWNSWLDGSQVELTTIGQVRGAFTKANLSWDSFEVFISNLYDEYKEEY